MINEDRARARKIQDKIIANRLTKAFVEDMGDDYPLFGEGTPTFNQISKFVYPNYLDRMESFLSNYEKKGE